MRPKYCWLQQILVICAIMLSMHAYAQPGRADYERALGLNERYKGLAWNVPESPVWIEGTEEFWYRKTVKGGNAFVLVDAAAQTKKPAFDHDRLAASLSSAGKEKCTGVTLPFSQIRFADKEGSVEFGLKSELWKCDLHTYACAEERPLKPGDPGFHEPDDWGEEHTPLINDVSRSSPSPDGQWEAFVQNFNVYLRRKGKDAAVPLSMDGSEDNYYDFSTLAWSPNSKNLVAYRLRPGYRRKVYYIESSPADQLQPKNSSIEYPKPGDVLDLQQPVLFDVTTKREINIDNALFPNPYELSEVNWWKDSRAFTFEYNQRGHQAYRVIEVNASTGEPRALISEESKTFIDYRRLVPDSYDTGKTYRYDVDDGKEIIWMSERDGWAHLYLSDGITGRLKQQITKGDWVVRSVDRVDEKSRQIWFEASGLDAGKDPYFVNAYRINFDGTGLTRFTEAEGNHKVVYSPDGKYYVDTWSTVDEPPTMELRRTEGKARLMELERGDIHELLAAGWKPPEVFHALGRDGKSDIWGVIYRPANFDPAKKYPVVEDIYAGPQGSFVPKSFTTRSEPLTQLGFVVVQIDGMGTNNRSKAFHDVAWKNLKDAGFPDRILWHKAVAAKYPWYDISRVGIFGTSSGGQSAMGALLFYPEFYKVAVANSGSHDNRMDKIWWNEQWMGWPVGPEYAASSNVDNAWRLQGKLLLILGEMDKNVDPSSTMQVVNALIRANKDFGLLVVPGAGHGVRGVYGERRLCDFFVRNLLGTEPPDWNRQSLEKERASR
jgi:dipeptidyl aminopeptidase/acylaminoacyl peptidase